MVELQEDRHQVQHLRRELFGLARAERELQREVGRRVLAGEDVVDLHALRRANRENQEDLSCAIVQLEAAAP